MLQAWIDTVLPGSADDPLVLRLLVASGGGLFAIMASAWMSMDGYFEKLVWCMLADLAMGLVVAISQGHFQSAELGAGFLRKVGVLIAVGLLHKVTDGMALGFPPENTAAIVFIAREIGSVYELLARIYPLPPTLLYPIRRVVAQMTQPPTEPSAQV